MERRVFIAVLLSFAVLYGYQALFVPPAPKSSPSTTTSTTAPPGESSPSASAPSATQPRRLQTLLKARPWRRW
jgi:hypothetical protein